MKILIELPDAPYYLDEEALCIKVVDAMEEYLGCGDYSSYEAYLSAKKDGKELPVWDWYDKITAKIVE